LCIRNNQYKLLPADKAFRIILAELVTFKTLRTANELSDTNANAL